MTGRDVMIGLGVIPENYTAVHFATTGVGPPIGIIQISCRSSQSGYSKHFVMPKAMELPSDLNYGYTGIRRPEYEKEVMSGEEVSEELLRLFGVFRPSVFVINSSRWLDRISKDPVNSGMLPLFRYIKESFVFPVSEYETARGCMGYTLFDAPYATFYEMAKHLHTMHRQTGRDCRKGLEDAYISRKGPELPWLDTISEEVCEQLVYVWNCIMKNNREQEMANG